MKITADTITDEQIRELRVAVRNNDPDMRIRGLCAEALCEHPCRACDHRASKGLEGRCPSCANARSYARARCAEILNARFAEEVRLSNEVIDEVIEEERREQGK